MALPIVDTAIAILRRGIKGIPVFRPDRGHLHHRLARAGMSRTRIVLTFYGCSLVFLGLGFVVALSHGRWLPLTFGIACMVLLLSAGSFQFSREWFAVGKVLGNSLGMRKETRYLFALGRWLELEADRSESRDALWRDFEFLVKKIGFITVALVPANGIERPSSQPDGSGPEQSSRQVLPGGEALEFPSASKLSPEVLELLAELATEIWVKALTRWERLNAESPKEAPQARPVLPLGRAETEVSQGRKQSVERGAWSSEFGVRSSSPVLK
jgi:UDP-GlcNAc:undecaprenyl-phosphate/decaprenyl-phosphate GlcNAc-1-phosphate transferase